MIFIELSGLYIRVDSVTSVGIHRVRKEEVVLVRSGGESYKVDETVKEVIAALESHGCNMIARENIFTQETKGE